MFLRNIKWDLTKQCFLNCSFCLNAEQRKSAEYQDISTNEIKIIIDKLSNAGVQHIQFLGGEPMYRKDFREIISYINNTTSIKVGFNTNGVLLNKEAVDFLLNTNAVTSICVSIDGLEQTHNTLRGGIVYNIIINNMKYVIEKRNALGKNIEIGVNTVACKANFNEFEKLVQILDNIGIDNWTYLEMQTKNRENEFSDVELDSILKRLAILSKSTKCRLIPKIVYPLTVDFYNKKYDGKIVLPIDNCGAGLSLGYINWHGDFYPCDRCLDTFYMSKEEATNFKEKKPLNLITQSPISAVCSPDFQKFSYIYNNDERNIFSECKTKCEFYHKQCFPCMIIGHNTKQKESPSLCHTLFQQAEEKIKELAKQDLEFQNNKTIFFSNKATFLCEKNNKKLILLNHENEKVFEIYDTSYYAMASLLTQYKQIEKRDLFLHWLENEAENCSFLNKNYEDLKISFKSILNDLIKGELAYAA